MMGRIKYNLLFANVTQAVQFPTDDRGVPEGNGCLTDKQVAVRVFPNMEWAEVVSAVTNNTILKAKFFGAKDLWLLILDRLGSNAALLWDPSECSAHCEVGLAWA